MSKIASVLFLILALGLILLVGGFDPLEFNQAVNGFFGWEPGIAEAGRLVPPETADELRLIAGRTTREKIDAEIRRFAGWGSRVPGYAGEDKAYRYIRERFEELGLTDVRTDRFPVTVPVDKGAELVVDGDRKIQLQALWPNGVRTPSLPEDGVEGLLFYAGKGALEGRDG